MYRYTHKDSEGKSGKYIFLAQKLANFLLNHPNMPEDLVPYWDYDDPQSLLRDSSAAAIMASALFELSTVSLVEEADRGRYFETAWGILKSLSSKKYRSELGESGGFILKHGVGNKPRNIEVDASLPYGDYYYLEALHRAKNILLS
jgi:hypothetical protein